MTAQLYLFCVLILESISGAACYDYDVGGLVAASLAAFIFLAAIVLMLMVIVLWRDWYMRRQARRGRYRVPREKWRLFKYNAVKKSGSHIETPRSERRTNMRMYNIAHIPGSKHTTLDRQEPITDAWVTRLPPANHYEEKSKTLNLEPEEEDVIIADVLPDTNLRTTQRTVQPVVVTTSNAAATQALTYQAASNTTYVSYKGGMSQSTAQTTQLRQTTPTEHITYEPYHVQVQMAQANQPAHNLSQTTRPVQQVMQTTRPAQQVLQSTRPVQQFSKTMPSGGGRGDIFIQPFVPASNPPDNQTTGYVVFDSDDEAGNVPATRQQTEDIVLF